MAGQELISSQVVLPAFWVTAPLHSSGGSTVREGVTSAVGAIPTAVRWTKVEPYLLGDSVPCYLCMGAQMSLSFPGRNADLISFPSAGAQGGQV